MMVATKNTKKNGMRSERVKEAAQCYAMIATQIIGFLTLSIYPIIWTFRWCTFFYDRVPSNTRFVGLQNFITLFTKDPSYWRGWITTFEFSLLKIPIEIPLALFLAVLLARKGLKGRGFYRAMYYMPVVISAAIVGLIFSSIFDSRGIINAWLVNLGFIEKMTDIGWFGKRATALGVLVGSSIWHTFGTNVIYFVAALSNVDESLYESATLDGANKWQSFWHITLPGIAPVLQTILMLSIIGTLGTNDFVLMMTNGAPGGQTHTVMSYMTSKYTPGFADTTTPNIGYGSAASIVTAIIFASISIAYNKLSGKMNTVND